MKTRNVFALGALLLVPAFTAGAQFTTVVAPQPAQKQAMAAVAAAKAEVPRDTGRRATLQAMSAWVDSVAGVPAPSAVVNDSVAGDVIVAADSTPPRAPSAGTTRFADGVRAPNTASPLPFLLVAGLGALLLGGWLLVTGRKEAPVPAAAPRRAS